MLTSKATKTERPLKNCKITFNSLLKVNVLKVPKPNKRSCSVWLIHLEWDQFEYQMRKMKVVVLLSVIVSMGQRLSRILKHTAKATYIFQIMPMHLHQVTLIYMENFRGLKENQEICSSRAVKILPSMITKFSSCISCRACTTAISKVRLVGVSKVKINSPRVKLRVANYRLKHYQYRL